MTARFDIRIESGASQFVISVLVLLLGVGAAAVQAEQTTQPSPRTTTTGLVSNLTRIESWNYFEPRPIEYETVVKFLVEQGARPGV